MIYPEVLSEFDTLKQIVAGRSLARYGDGEFKICRGAGIKSQEKHPTLTARMCDILHESGECLVGIPNIRSDTTKAEFWGKYMASASYLVARQYVSSFVTRPDSAPWIDTPDYWALLETLWINQDVTLVRGSQKSLMADDLVGARTVTEIIAPRQHAWVEYESILERVGTPKRCIICLGPTATIMAVDLCAKGVHAMDLGHVGLFLRKHRRGLPMWLSKDDKEAAR